MILEESIVSGIMGGFISKIINDGVDESRFAIKKAIENKANNNGNFQTQIYQIIINILNQLTYNRYINNQEKI